MTRKILILIQVIFICLITDLDAQKIGRVSFQQEENKIIVNFAIKGAEKGQSFNADIYISTDGGKTFKGPLVEVSGDIGEGIEAGKKKIVWDVLDEMPTLEGDIVFEIRAEIIDTLDSKPEEEMVEKLEEKPPSEKESGTGKSPEKTIEYNGSVYAPLGLSFGILNPVGFYISGRFHPSFFQKSDYSVNADGRISIDDNPYLDQFPGEYQLITHVEFTGGINIRASDKLYVFAGAGYGKRNHFTQIIHIDNRSNLVENKEYVLDERDDKTVSGIVLEAGLKLLLNKVIISAGATSFSLNSEIDYKISPVFSVGYVFR